MSEEVSQLQNKSRVINYIKHLVAQLKSCENDYEKDHLVRGIGLNFEFLGRLEFALSIQSEQAQQEASKSEEPLSEISVEEPKSTEIKTIVL